MKLTIDTEAQTLTLQTGDGERTLELYGKESFQLLSREWVKAGWCQKYSYTFSWLGFPIIQLPEDLLRIQEVIFRVKPDVIVETGIAHGGSLIFYSSLCKILGRGRVIGVDIDIRPHNRRTLEASELFPTITLVEGSSIDSEVVSQVKDLIKPGETVLVLLDSCHTKDHVAAELEAYHDLVTPGSYIVATDGIMMDLYDVPQGQKGWRDDHPTAAATQFALAHPEFEQEQPAWVFNESNLDQNVTYWPGAWLRRRTE